MRELLGTAFRPAPPTPTRGRPPLIPALMLWAGLLVCLLRQQCSAQLDLWRLLTRGGLWDFPRVDVSDMAVYQRLARTPATHMAAFFAQITTALQVRLVDHPPAVSYARFASAVLALDHTTLDPVLRKLKLLRNQPPGAPTLLPGQLACLFDLRRQQWLRAEFVPDAARNVKHDVDLLLNGVPPGALLLFDLGYFSFAWFDHLTTTGYYWVSRQRAKTSYQVRHVLYAGGAGACHLRDQRVYLGAYRADRAAQPVRLVEITVGERTFTYLTNVLDPRRLPAWEVAALYQRRWNVEQAFNLVKTHLGLSQLWSGQQNALLHQVYGTLILAQILLGLRGEVAVLAGVDPREVSLPLLIRWLPRFAAQGGAGRRPVGALCGGRAAAGVHPAVPGSGAHGAGGRRHRLPLTGDVAHRPRGAPSPPQSRTAAAHGGGSRADEGAPGTETSGASPASAARARLKNCSPAEAGTWR